MIKSNRIIEIAREYIGTPIVMQARVKGVGIDCVGLIVCIAKDLGLPIKDYAEYRPRAVGLINRMKEQFIETEELLPGSILALCSRPHIRRAQHLAIFTGTRLIHAHLTAKKIVEHGFGKPYPERVVGIFQYPGVIYG